MADAQVDKLGQQFQPQRTGQVFLDILIEFALLPWRKTTTTDRRINLGRRRQESRQSEGRAAGGHRVCNNHLAQVFEEFQGRYFRVSGF